MCEDLLPFLVPTIDALAVRIIRIDVMSSLEIKTVFYYPLAVIYIAPFSALRLVQHTFSLRCNRLIDQGLDHNTRAMHQVQH